MQQLAISGWHDHIRDGRQYLQTACRGLSRPTVFNNELIFQLAAMAIEKLIVGVCQYHHRMPFDHTLSGLVGALAPECPMDAGLAEQIKDIERFDDMCALTPHRRKGPGDMDIRRILDVGRQVAGFAEKHVPWDGPEVPVDPSNRQSNKPTE